MHLSHWEGIEKKNHTVEVYKAPRPRVKHLQFACRFYRSPSQRMERAEWQCVNGAEGFTVPPQSCFRSQFPWWMRLNGNIKRSRAKHSE